MKAQRITNKELLLFKEVVKALEEQEIPYWLDQGSLLGIIRDGKFLPWDHDIDLGVLEKDLQSYRESLIHRLRCSGYYVTVMPYVIKITSGDRKIRSVDLRVYQESGDFVYTELRSTMDKYNKWKRVQGITATQTIKFGHLLYRLAYQNPGIKQKKLKNWGKKIINNWSLRRESLKNRRVVLKVEKMYFENLKEVEVYGLQVKVPSFAEDYLQLKYGQSWRFPQKKWKYWEDDGALYKHEYLPKRINYHE